MLHERIKEAFDISTASFFGGAGIHFATITEDPSFSKTVGAITIAIGICKLIEIFTGRKIHTFFKKKKK